MKSVTDSVVMYWITIAVGRMTIGWNMPMTDSNGNVTEAKMPTIGPEVEEFLQDRKNYPDLIPVMNH